MENADNEESLNRTENYNDNIESIDETEEKEDTSENNEWAFEEKLKNLYDELTEEFEKQENKQTTEEVGKANEEKKEHKKKSSSKKQKLKERIWKLLNQIKPDRESRMKKRPMITRDQWGAREPRERVPLKFPVHKVLFVQTRTEECFNKEDCIKIIQRLQNQHMDERGLPDIEYNFLIGSDKNIYEGRGWMARPDKNEKYPELFDKKIEYAYIGTYDDHEPPERIQQAAWKLLEDGIIFDKMFEKFRVFEDYYQPVGRVDDLVKKYVTKEPVVLVDSDES